MYVLRFSLDCPCVLSPVPYRASRRAGLDHLASPGSCQQPADCSIASGALELKDITRG